MSRLRSTPRSGPVAALMILLAVTGVSAQSGRLVGTVHAKGTGEPVANVFLALPSLGRAMLADGTGAFAFEELPPGRYELTAQHISYTTVTADVDIGTGTTARVEILMPPAPVEIDPIDVRVEGRNPYLEARGFYERRERGWGLFWDPGRSSA